MAGSKGPILGRKMVSRSFTKARRAFLADRSGNVAMMWGLMGTALVGLLGLTVDFSRAQALRAQLQDAADGAALVAERSSNLPMAQREAAARAYFDAEMGDLAPGATFSIAQMGDGGHMAMAQMPMDISLASVVSRHPWAIEVSSEAEAQASPPIEVVMALDNTGSMASDMNTLKEGAIDLAEFLLSLDGDTVHVGVVPFNAQVNIGANNQQWVDTTDTNPLNGVMFEGRYLGRRDNSTNSATGNCNGANYPTTYGGFPVRWIKGDTSHPGTAYDDNRKCYAFSPAQVNVWSLYDNLPNNAQWRGCVEERPEPFDINDAAPSPLVPGSMFVPYFAMDDGGDVGSPRNNWITSGTYDTTNPLGLSGSPTWTAGASVRTMSVYKYRANVPVDIGTGVTGRGPNRGCPMQAIVPLTTNRTTVTNALNAMVADGYTNQNPGLAWAWRVISPGAPFTEGRPYNDPNDPVRKVIVLFTDGDNTVESGNNSVLASEYNGHGYRTLWSRFQTEQVPTVSGSTVTWSAALTPAFRRTGIASNGDMVNYFNTRQLQMCNAIKAQDIEIYTIGFRISAGGTADNLLRNCATQDGTHYYHADDQQELLAAFAAIGTGIGQLRLTN
jgi:Flp pilus assembly protein TadG